MEKPKNQLGGRQDELDQLVREGAASTQKPAAGKDPDGWDEPVQSYQFPASKAASRGGQIPAAAKNALFISTTTKVSDVPHVITVKKKKEGSPSKGKGFAGNAKQAAHQEDHDDDSSSLVEEKDQKPSISKIKKMEIPKNPEPATNSISIPATDQKDMVVEDDPLQSQYKRITSLDELYVEKNFLVKNHKEPYHSIDPTKETVVAQILEGRYLPDTVNFVRMKGFFFSSQGNAETRLSPMLTSMMELSGDVNQMEFNTTLLLEKTKADTLDSVFLLLVWESFQDIFGEDEVEFSPLIFGFSIVKIFEADGMRSGTSVVGWSVNAEMEGAEGTLPIRSLPSCLSETRSRNPHQAVHEEGASSNPWGIHSHHLRPCEVRW